MNFTLTQKQKNAHATAQENARIYFKSERNVIISLLIVKDTNAHLALGLPKLFSYCVQYLKCTAPVAYSLSAVTEKCRELPILRKAFEDQKLCVSRAQRLLSVLTAENAEELITFAVEHTCSEIDQRVAALRPRQMKRSILKPVSATHCRLSTNLKNETAEKLKRVQALESQRAAQRLDFDPVVGVLCDQYLFKNDPVQKAARFCINKTRGAKKESVQKPKKESVGTRAPVSAEAKHVVHHRDQGRCTFIDATGTRCKESQMLHLHHIVPRAAGGGNEPENLATLCWFHHDWTHQMNLPLEGRDAGSSTCSF